MSQWAEVRQMHLVEGIPKKQVARRLGIDVKTVRRAVAQEKAPLRRESPPRGKRLDRWRKEIEALLVEEPRISAKRIARLLEPKTGPLRRRTVRRYVAELRGELYPKEVFIHRTAILGDMMEVDFGESWAEIGGRRRKVKYLVATLPASNAYFAKVYPVERLECLLDGIAEAFVWFGGTPRRVVFDNTSLAVRKVLKGTEREENVRFHAFRGEWPFHADFCAPAKGWEKGSVERGVEYVRGLGFRPVPKAESFDELNARLLEELDHDLDQRTLPDGRTARQALIAEREHLRPLPAHRPETCRVISCVANKYGHVRVDRSTYSVQTRHARKVVTVKLFHDRVVITHDGAVLACHERSFRAGSVVIDPLHVLELLEKKHRAVSESTAILQWQLPETFDELREELRKRTRKPDREWVRILRLAEAHPLDELESAVRMSLERGSPRLETVQMILRHGAQGDSSAAPPPAVREELLAIEIAEPVLSDWDHLCGGDGR